VAARLRPRASGGLVSLEASKEVRRRYTERVRDLEDVGQADVPFASLDCSHVAAVKAAAVTKLLLREPLVFS
jgi:hypothetical protein